MLATLDLLSSHIDVAGLQIPGTISGQPLGDRRPPMSVGRNLKAIVPTSISVMPRQLSLPNERHWETALIATARRLAGLKQGWDGEGSIPVERGLLDEATLLVRQSLQGSLRAVCPYLVPGGDGSIQIEWHRKHGELELDLATDGSRWIWVRDHDTGEEFEGENEKALALFSRWAPWMAAPRNNEIDVHYAPNTSIYGTLTELQIYQNNSVS